MRGPRWSLALLLALLSAALPALPALAATPASAASGPEPPALELRERALAVSTLPPILARPEVRPHLSTGLTTTFAVEVNAVDAQGHRAKGGGRIDVRYELWDEVFLVSATGADGRAHRESLPSFDRLLAWWRGLVLPVLAADPLSASGPWRVAVRLSVIPFSQSEQRDTQRWLTESIERRERGDAAAPRARPEPLSGTLDALIATSIQRQRLVGYDWTLVFQPERRR
jgi:hypothetical protein